MFESIYSLFNVNIENEYTGKQIHFLLDLIEFQYTTI